MVNYLVNLQKKNFLEIYKIFKIGIQQKISKAAETALNDITAVQLSTSLHSLDLNPIEYAFSLVKKTLRNDVVKYFISKEHFKSYTFDLFVLFDNIIQSMPKKLSQVMQSKSHCLKY